MAAHPLKIMMNAGLACSIGSDDPLLFGGSLLEEYRLARDEIGLSEQDLAACAKTSFGHSAAPARLQLKAMVAIREWLNDDESHYRIVF